MSIHDEAYRVATQYVEDHNLPEPASINLFAVDDSETGPYRTASLLYNGNIAAPSGLRIERGTTDEGSGYLYAETRVGSVRLTLLWDAP
jgi:hypothetical protein